MTESCPRCDGARFRVVVPKAIRTHAAAPILVCCDRCLAADPVDDEGASDVAIDAAADPPVERICRRFPPGDGGVGLIVLLQHLDSLALNRAAIESLVAFLETEGVDLFLTLDRLLASPDAEPYFDLARRRDQLAQLLDW